ncbi:G1/S-specific cyclin-E isoform X1 [Drosophila albomicans]|uniref:G1/S-specific cyclin-E isoform X1 n=2 Tax=Drosophila albomicans TaxID=7291 RepID=A0A6P8W2G2_DROAB|nr:G1/S-specific cyclin-E isoform X1 [Drosophila albomicans]XP_051858346.1 G1/S-specific cyclin-E isoform X1 [Drosophila albomicans]
MDLYAKSANTTSSSRSTANASQEQIVTPASINSIDCSSSSSSTGAAASAAAAATSSTSTHHWPWSSVSTTSDMCSCDSQKNATSATFATGSNKRKRRSSSKDPELGFEPPSAKRQQRQQFRFVPASAYGSDQSNQSSVYTSPLTATAALAAAVAQDVLSIRSSPAEELSEAPHSPLPDSPDSPPSPDRGNKQQPVVVRCAAEQSKANEVDDEEVLDDSSEDYSFDEDEEDVDDEDEQINSSSSSPASSTTTTTTGCSQNGERTPATATQQLHDPSNAANRTVLKLNQMDSAMPHNNYKCMSPAMEYTLRQCPLPALSWANAADVWKNMCLRDEQDSHLRSSSMLEHHPGLQPRMRAILLDWLIEVCEVYKLHRETFYLAVDYLDRYLNGERQVQKTHLQLIGITCLFVAAKVEEIYPPKICEFAYVTDGACTERDILQHEKILLQALGWDICPLTVTGWLGVYMQLNVNNRTPASLTQIGQQAAAANATTTGEADDAFIYPQFSGFEFVQTTQLLDLCTLDVGMANYPYSVLAAAAISHTFDRETALRCSGLDWETVHPCARWMEPFFHVISKKAPYLHMNEQNEQVTNKFGLAHICPNIVTDDSHIIQTHTTTMDMYDELLMAQNALHAMRARTQASPATALRAPESLLTPPASSHKPDEYLGDEDEVVAATVTATATATATAAAAVTAASKSSSSSSRVSSHKQQQ